MGCKRCFSILPPTRRGGDAAGDRWKGTLRVVLGFSNRLRDHEFDGIT
jgi:hypothetical protein